MSDSIFRANFIVSIGPVFLLLVRRQQQLLECEEVLESFEMHGQGPSNIIITREALEKGLMIPQDRPKVYIKTRAINYISP